ncbi:hypothetical protein OAO55_02000 [Bacteroidales bacterium]|nr:hypothetical protein [Bacteroidales bacterium]
MKKETMIFNETEEVFTSTFLENDVVELEEFNGFEFGDGFNAFDVEFCHRYNETN